MDSTRYFEQTINCDCDAAAPGDFCGLELLFRTRRGGKKLENPRIMNVDALNIGTLSANVAYYLLEVGGQSVECLSDVSIKKTFETAKKVALSKNDTGRIVLKVKQLRLILQPASSNLQTPPTIGLTENINKNSNSENNYTNEEQVTATIPPNLCAIANKPTKQSASPLLKKQKKNAGIVHSKASKEGTSKAKQIDQNRSASVSKTVASEAAESLNRIASYVGLTEIGDSLKLGKSIYASLEELALKEDSKDKKSSVLATADRFLVDVRNRASLSTKAKLNPANLPLVDDWLEKNKRNWNDRYHGNKKKDGYMKGFGDDAEKTAWDEKYGTLEEAEASAVYDVVSAHFLDNGIDKVDDAVALLRLHGIQKICSLLELTFEVCRKFHKTKPTICQTRFESCLKRKKFDLIDGPSMPYTGNIPAIIPWDLVSQEFEELTGDPSWPAEKCLFVFRCFMRKVIFEKL
eukprot:g3500.t1